MPRKRKPHRSGAESAKLVRAHHATDAVNWQSGMAGFGQPVALRQQRRCLYRRARFGQTSLASVGRAADARDRQLAEPFEPPCERQKVLRRGVSREGASRLLRELSEELLPRECSGRVDQYLSGVLLAPFPYPIIYRGSASRDLHRRFGPHHVHRGYKAC